jgi:hypothetical protein
MEIERGLPRHPKYKALDSFYVNSMTLWISPEMTSIWPTQSRNAKASGFESEPRGKQPSELYAIPDMEIERGLPCDSTSKIQSIGLLLRQFYDSLDFSGDDEHLANTIKD